MQRKTFLSYEKKMRTRKIKNWCGRHRLEDKRRDETNKEWKPLRRDYRSITIVAGNTQQKLGNSDETNQ